MGIFKSSAKEKREREILIIIFFTRAFFIGIIIFEILNFLRVLEFNLQFTWLGLVITSIFALTLLEFIAYKYKQKKGHYLHWSIWLIIAAALSLDAMGDFFFLYAKFPWWDQVVHYFVSAVITFTLFVVISAFWIDKFKYSLLFKSGRLKLSLFLAATSTISLSALYEVEEYVEDIFFKTNRLGPGVDTASDLLFNFLGVASTVIFITIYYLITHKRKVI